MPFLEELNSWKFPVALKTQSVPSIGDKSPSSPELELPCGDGKPAILSFLRHCGCPFAEKTFRVMRTAAESHPDIHFIAISHSDKASTDKWLEAIGGPGKIGIIVDSERQLFSQWGLGVSSFWHVLNPWSLWSVIRLGRSEGIWNRATQSGNRWQTAGSFAVDGKGTVTWGNANRTADDIADFDAAVQSVEG